MNTEQTSKNIFKYIFLVSYKNSMFVFFSYMQTKIKQRVIFSDRIYWKNPVKGLQFNSVNDYLDYDIKKYS